MREQLGDAAPFTLSQPGLMRWFIPGDLGSEPGTPPPPTSERGFRTRALALGPGDERAEWAERNGLTPRLGFSHNLNHVVPASLFDERPELFPQIDGERWRPEPGRLNWNPDLGEPATAALAATAAREHFQAHPDAVSFPLGVNDGLRFGESEATRRWVVPVRWFRQRPDYSDLVFSFMNRTAAAISAEWPGKHLGALAYYWCENTPRFAVHPQVLPFLTADRSQFHDAAFRREELALQRRWGRAGPGRLGIYDYLYGSGFLIPRHHPHALALHLRHARRAGFTDYYAETYPNWGLDGPQPWLVAQLLQDPEQPVDRLLDEFYRRYFRGAARPMRRFFDRCERIWNDQPGPAYWLKHYRNESQAALFPPQVCASLRRELQAAGVAARGDDRTAARVALVSEAFGVTERLAALHESRVELARALLRPGDLPAAAPAARTAATVADANELRRRLNAYRAARRDLKAYVERLQAAQPLALHHYRLDDFLRHDPGPTAEHRLTVTETETFSGASQPNSLVSFRGPLRPALEIAGLPYGVALPAPWHSTVEPWQGLVARIAGPAEDPVLRLESNKLTTIYQWLPATPGAPCRAQLDVRGTVGPSTIVALSVSWLNAEHQRLGASVDVRLPEGEWPEWLTLSNLATAPVDARWIGIMFWVAHQQPTDRLEVRRIQLSPLGEPAAP